MIPPVLIQVGFWKKSTQNLQPAISREVWVRSSLPSLMEVCNVNPIPVWVWFRWLKKSCLIWRFFHHRNKKMVFVRIQACGEETGVLNTYTIHGKDLVRAQKAGFILFEVK